MPTPNLHSFHIPHDIRPKATGLKLDIPVGLETIRHEVKPSAIAVRVSLRTHDKREQTTRKAQVNTYLGSVWDALRHNQSIPLTHRQAVKLSQDLYVIHAKEGVTSGVDIERVEGKLAFAQVDPYEAMYDAEVWEEIIGRHTSDDIDLEKHFGKIVDRLLLKHGVASVHPSSRPMVLREFRNALRDGYFVRARREQGDYSDDPKAGRFGSDDTPILVSDVKGSLTGLVEGWWSEAAKAGRSESTYRSFKSTMHRFTKHLGHDDLRRGVTQRQVLAYKDARLAAGKDPKTVAANDLVGLRTVFKWAISNHKMAGPNPCDDVKVVAAKKMVLRDKDFTPDEALAILRLASNYKQIDRETTKSYLSRRWLPWLCAYTGARVGELVQLRPQDVRREGDMVVITITPEAGTVKDKRKREVVLHDHIVEQGFMDVVRQCNSDYIFIEQDASILVGARTVKSRMASFVREVVTDPDVAPNHGWRHTFKTVGREAGIADSILDAICGHAAKHVGGAYGRVTLATQAAAMLTFPRYPVEKP